MWEWHKQLKLENIRRYIKWMLGLEETERDDIWTEIGKRVIKFEEIIFTKEDKEILC